MNQDYATLLGMTDDRTHKEHVQLTSQCLNVVEASDVLNTKLCQETLNEYEDMKQTRIVQRMVVTLEEDKTAEKKATNAADASSNEAPVSVEATKSATTSTSRRLKLETRQVLDDAIYQCASRVSNVRKT